MTDERDLHELAAPLLADPPHHPPPLDELERRVTRRRQRRARAIGLCSVVAVVLVAAGVLALPRGAELRAGDGSATAPTTEPPPPLEPGPVLAIVDPESAPLASARTITIRVTGDHAYDTCGFSYDLYRWSGSDWQPMAAIYLGADPPALGEYSPVVAPGDCSVTRLDPGTERSMNFSIADASWHPRDGTTPPRTDRLTVGQYELRHQIGYSDVDPQPLGRFEITPPGTQTGPPGMEAGPVQMIVTPESAALDAERTIEIRNTSPDTSYTSCGSVYDLFRWDGASWTPVVRMRLNGGDTVFDEYDASPTSDTCGPSPTSLAPGESTSMPFHPNSRAWFLVSATAPPGTTPLADGWYELREPVNGDDRMSSRPMGRFEVTPEASPAEPTPTTFVPPPEDEAPVSVDLYPLDLVPAGEVLPTTVFVVDQDTIALAWTGGCNQPADHVTFDAHDGEVELRLHVGRFPVIDCFGEPDDWMVTFDVPFTITDRVRLVARAAGTEGEVDRVPGAILGSVGGSSRLADPTPTSFRVVDLDPSDPKLRDVRLLLPYPLGDASAACDVSLSGHNTVMVPEVWIDSDPATSGCSDEQLTVQLNPGTTVLGQG